ncbi:hypothetical protein GCM10022288_04280 [Gryllotalpicola kribbensis]|jgi:hypothetical protein|uniref:DUF3618 domain-containing protein n=1 Tax=Gryllotalpicola kribbensis TaxID=993084 RepID=A0ABP8AHM1_9MICO
MDPYTAGTERPPFDAEALRSRIPGWGADSDPADRPSSPRERFDPAASGAHWDVPERQAGGDDRERSIEHRQLTPVFGTTSPLRGVSGVIRRFAYDNFSEGRAAHWLLLIAGDRVEAMGARFERDPVRAAAPWLIGAAAVGALVSLRRGRRG